MTIQFDPQKGQFTMEAAELAYADEQIRDYIGTGRWDLMAEEIGRLVNLHIPYMSYVPAMYSVRQVAEMPAAPTIATVDYVGTANVSSPTQTATYVRATFNRVQPTIEYIEGGGWYHKRDARFAGWNAAQEVAKQIAWEKAKKLDTWLGTILDAGTGLVSASASALDFDTFRGIVADAEAAQYPVTRMICTKSRAMDTADWGTANVTWLWGQAPSGYANQIVKTGFISDFMGITMEQFNSMANTTIYFYGNPADYGRELLLVGPEDREMDYDIDNKTTRFNMEQLYWQTTASCADVTKVTIS